MSDRCAQCGQVPNPDGQCACSKPPPLWYTEEELRHYLKAVKHYSDEIASELAQGYSRNLQNAFQKGWEMSQAAATSEKVRLANYTYASEQATTCAGCGKLKHTPLRNDAMGGYVCLTCIDKELERLQKLELKRLWYEKTELEKTGSAETAEREGPARSAAKAGACQAGPGDADRVAEVDGGAGHRP